MDDRTAKAGILSFQRNNCLSAVRKIDAFDFMGAVWRIEIQEIVVQQVFDGGYRGSESGCKGEGIGIEYVD